MNKYGAATAIVACAFLLMAGCNAPARSSSGSNSTIGNTSESEPNDSVVNARPISFDSSNSSMVTGDIEAPGDVDMFKLGPLSAGDRLVVDVDALTPGFDSSIAVFDSELNLVMDNDDEDTDAKLFDSVLDEIIRHDDSEYFLAVSHSSFAGTNGEVGGYQISVLIEPGGEVPEAKRQFFLLDFDGGPVESPNLLVDEVEPFSGEAINEVYLDQDGIIRRNIIDTMFENFAPFNVVVVTEVAEIPSGEPFSTIMFGSRSAIAFGISESVDHYNKSHDDQAIIFTESFAPFQFERTPSAEQLGIAIGNIAAHEAGHLMGLNHVTDSTDLMDGVSPADTFLMDQDFKRSTLSNDILPIGYQDSVLLLSESVGLFDGQPLKARQPRMLPPLKLVSGQGAPVYCGTCARLGWKKGSAG